MRVCRVRVYRLEHTCLMEGMYMWHVLRQVFTQVHTCKQCVYSHVNMVCIILAITSSLIIFVQLYYSRVALFYFLGKPV